MFTIIWNNNITINRINFIYKKKKKMPISIFVYRVHIVLIISISLFDSHFFVLFVEKIQNIICHMKYQ